MWAEIARSGRSRRFGRRLRGRGGAGGLGADRVEPARKAEGGRVLDEQMADTVKISSPAGTEHLFKVLVIGELGVGKTSIIKRTVHQLFSEKYRATIGVDFALKVLQWDSNTLIRLQLWDIAGQERFGNMTRVYYKEAVGAFVVFDIARRSTFDAVLKWKSDLDANVKLPNGKPIPAMLLANKCDQDWDGLEKYPATIDQYCKDNGFVGWFETSAKLNTNIDDAIQYLVRNILDIECTNPSEDNGTDDDYFLHRISVRIYIRQNF
ncbi:ras-related protein Rab-32-like isoform X2 [Narcine bancroftii]|uniref:ras-related protein Rab-32-like isoform X2 n=1 Tax=Narcine bancroftii TaxID=1343680 RepID=UPI003831D3EC